MIRESIFAILIFLFLYTAVAQQSVILSSGDPVTIAANPNLQASGFHRFLFGSLWRDVWATPVDVRILHLNTPDCDLTFDKLFTQRRESNVTRAFLFKDKEGNEFFFTRFNQDSASSLPAELSNLLPLDIVADQMSTLNPYAPLIVVPILQAVGLPYREVQLVVLSSNLLPENRLLQTNDNLGILEGTLRIPSKEINLLSDEIFETSYMLECLESDIQNRVDELQYLKARLIDIFLGDWDRSADQWRWYKTQMNSETVWIPIPLIHRQAFVRLNGLLPAIADLAIPQMENCGKNISGIENLTLTGRFLDRRFLISYPKQIWDSLASWIQNQLSDSVLAHAISNLPVPILEKEGESLLRLLKARRGQLSKAANGFYKLSSAYVDINGSNQAERAEIRRIGRHMVSVTLFNNTDASQVPIYKRLFHDDFTKEIRVLLRGGDDIANIEGEEISTIKIIIDGGKGRNELIDKSKSRSVFGSVNPFSAGGTFFYEYNPESRIKAGSNTQVLRDFSKKYSAIELNKKVTHRDWGSEWSFSPWLDINPDDGLFIGGGPVYTEYAYRIEPYSRQIIVRAGLATRTMRYRLDATGEFRDWLRGVRTFIQLHASQLDFSNFFGSGNETRYIQALNNSDFYKVDQRQIFLHTALDFTLAADLSAAIGSTIKLIDNNPKPETLLNSLSPPYYNKSLTFLNLNARLQTDNRDNERLPAQGVYAKAECSYLPELLDNTNSFYKLKGEVRSYHTFQNFHAITVAFRAAGEKIWGDHPFFESAFLGGNESLRGFERQRFAGDASIMGGVELRARITHIPFIVPLWVGLTGFAETGRVFLKSEQSNRWHNVIGGGIWFSLIKPEYVANFSIARSEDQIAFYATMGFMF